MLQIYYGEVDVYPKGNLIYDTSSFFDVMYDPKWLADDWAKRMIKDVSDCIVESPTVVYSPIFGQLPPERLAGGIKTLLLCKNNHDYVYNATTCGDNCAKWFLDLAKDRDLKINLQHYMHFPEDSTEVMILNNGKVYELNSDDFFFTAATYVSKHPHVNRI